MTSKETWWWVGIGTGVGVLVSAGVALVARGLQRPASPSTEPPAKPLTESSGGPAGSTALRGEICRRWESEQDRPVWRDDLNALIQSDIDNQIEIFRPQWTTIQQLEISAYIIARAALAQGCPLIPLPKGPKNANDLAQTAPPYWRELWNRYYKRSYVTLSGLRA